MNKHIDQKIAEYLANLKQALKGEDPALIQDAQYDAEEHLRAALAEVSEPESAFSELCENYGSPEEIASYYRNMEASVNLALHGYKQSAKQRRATRFMTILCDIKAYTSLLYLLLVLPIGIGYFAWIAMVGFTSLTLSLLVIGLPLLFIFLSSMPFFAFLEGRLIEMLLGQRMPRRPHYQRNTDHWKARLSHTLKSRKHWTTVGYLLLQLPLGCIYFACITIPFVMSIAIFLSPIVDPLLHWLNPIRYQIDIDWYWFPLAMPGGLIGLMITLFSAKALGYLHARLARYLLVSKMVDD